MTEPSSSLSRAEFDRLIAHASKLDDEGHERIDLEQARAIAHDLGISAAAWDLAVRERESTVKIERAQQSARELRRRLTTIVLAGLTAGGISGAIASQLSDASVFLGGAAIAAGVALLLRGMRRESLRSAQLDLAAWWISIPAGIMVGMRATHGDPMVFAAMAWAGCAALGFVIDRVRRRAPSATPVAQNGTA